MELPWWSRRKLMRREQDRDFTQVFGIAPQQATMSHTDLMKDHLISLAREDLLSSDLSKSRFEPAFRLAVQLHPYIRENDRLEVFIKAGRQLGQQLVEIQRSNSDDSPS